MIHHFERIAMPGVPPNGDRPADVAGVANVDEEGFQREPEGRLHMGLESEGDDTDSTPSGMSDEFKMGLGIVLGFLTLIAVVVGALLTKLIRQNKLANPDVVKLQHNSILYSPSKLTGDDWKVPITGFSPGGSAFGFSPLGKTPSPLGKGQGQAASPSPESDAQPTSKTPSPLSKNSLGLSSPEQGKVMTHPSPDTPSTDSAKRSRRFFPASPWAV